jgi:electron transfer flavoprotein beta subunit
MKVAVCVKQIPDTADPPALDPRDHTLLRTGKLIMDESDGYGVEMGLRLVEAGGGGEVSLVSMAPNGETNGLRTALAIGASRAVVVSDPLLAGSDALGTAKVLAAVIARLGVDLVIAGTESTDGYTGTTPVQVAELLGWPSVSFAEHVEISDGLAKVRRQTEAGQDEIRCPLPAVITVTSGAVEPRYPSFKGIAAAKSKPVEQVTVTDLGLDPSQVGFCGARQQVISVEAADTRRAGEIVVDQGDAHQRLLGFLEQLKVL